MRSCEVMSARFMFWGLPGLAKSISRRHLLPDAVRSASMQPVLFEIRTVIERKDFYAARCARIKS